MLLSITIGQYIVGGFAFIAFIAAILFLKPLLWDDDEDNDDDDLYPPEHFGMPTQ